MSLEGPTPVAAPHLGDEAMAPDLGRHRQAAGHEHGRPVDRMEAQDVLAYDVVGWPAVLLQVLFRRLCILRQQACVGPAQDSATKGDARAIVFLIVKAVEPMLRDDQLQCLAG